MLFRRRTSLLSVHSRQSLQELKTKEQHWTKYLDGKGLIVCIRSHALGRLLSSLLPHSGHLVRNLFSFHSWNTALCTKTNISQWKFCHFRFQKFAFVGVWSEKWSGAEFVCTHTHIHQMSHSNTPSHLSLLWRQNCPDPKHPIKDKYK